ncbi:MAG: hypothetical protein QOF18_116, partial [Frankiaceae bacterium]|nr:hypothetical protein [Frankiaceae bacterium]
MIERMFEGLAIRSASGDTAVEQEYYDRLAAESLLATPGELPPEMRSVPVEWAATDDAWLDALVAGDPDRPRHPAAVVADAETLPVTAGLVGELAAVDPARLDASA